jgi:hypothetical protein
MLALADMMHFFADELARLRAGRFTFPLILFGSFERLSFRHRCPPSIDSGQVDAAVIVGDVDG